MKHLLNHYSLSGCSLPTPTALSFIKIPFIICVLSNYFFFFLDTLHSMWDLSSPTRGWTHVLCNGSTSLNHRTTRKAPKYILPKICLWFCNSLSHKLYRLVLVSKKRKKKFVLNITTFRNISILPHQIRQNYFSSSMFAPVNAQDTPDLHPMQTLS